MYAHTHTRALARVCVMELSVVNFINIATKIISLYKDDFRMKDV